MVASQLASTDAGLYAWLSIIHLLDSQAGMPSRRRFMKREELEDIMSASTTTLRSLRSLVEQHGGTFVPPRWALDGLPTIMKGRVGKGPPRPTRRQLAAAAVIAFAPVPHNQVFETVRTFLTSAEHVLVAVFKERQEMRIHIQAGGVEVTLQGPYSTGEALRLFDDAVKAKNAGKR